ncbi:hypothetical protein Pmani_005293 [Petrolisthes manimaculis]|uniref:Uncharacterized protein n=1 Tax=Petrolisthes manimaculis TaxID=1843537 RepID=A0AAE1QCH4_9EUCA|nr:hypothetical protein Pmani_005293 [Petrolisthes manimaculis]
MARKIGRVGEESVSETRNGGGVVHVAGGGFCHACANVSNNHDNGNTSTHTGSSDSLASDEDSSSVDPISRVPSTVVSPSSTSSDQQISSQHTPSHQQNLNQANLRNLHSQRLLPFHHHHHHTSHSTGNRNNHNNNNDTTITTFTFAMDVLRTLFNSVNDQASHTWRTTHVAVEEMNIILAIHCFP